MQQIQYLVHSYSEPNAPSLVHGYTATEEDAKTQLQVVARSAFKEATKQHLALKNLADKDVEILSFEHYEALAKCTDPHSTYFLAGHCLVYADEKHTTIELIKWSVESKWRYFRYVTTEGPALVRVFSVLNGSQQSGLTITLPVVASETVKVESENNSIPTPPPPPAVGKQLSSVKKPSSNRLVTAESNINTPSPLPSQPGQPLTPELLARVAARRNFLENSRIELPEPTPSAQPNV
uniref:Uncharacterized protein n=1 Tax=Clandestinovirus TaxID=2831644 RepID=A0A8F8KPD3_9VIRU|nr:hypothetical protein KOM_12_347 [Clandestinovirus]